MAKKDLGRDYPDVGGDGLKLRVDIAEARGVVGCAAHGGVQAEPVDVGAQRLLKVPVPGHALQAALALASVSPSRRSSTPTSLSA